MAKETEEGGKRLREMYDQNLGAVRARLLREPDLGRDSAGNPILRYCFGMRKEREHLELPKRAHLTLPQVFLPSLNGGRSLESPDPIDELLADLRGKESLRYQLKIQKDRRHGMSIEFFVANWEYLVNLIHPHARQLTDPEAFCEVKIMPNDGPVDFIGVAPDGTIFIAEFGRGGQAKHRQLQRYLDEFVELFPNHADHVHPFLVNLMHEGPHRNMVLDVVEHAPSSSVAFPPNGDRSRQ